MLLMISKLSQSLKTVLVWTSFILMTRIYPDIKVTQESLTTYESLLKSKFGLLHLLSIFFNLMF